MEAHPDMNWDLQIYGGGETGYQYMCDLCDRKIPLEDIQKTEESVFLCPECYSFISAMPRGKVKDIVMKYLVGNVR